MANYADVVLRITGKDINLISNEIKKLDREEISIEFLIMNIKKSFTDPDKLLKIDNFLKIGDKRFSFVVTDDSKDILELEGQSAWCEPIEAIQLLESLYDIKIYYLVYEPSNEIYESNDVNYDVFDYNDYRFALDSDNNYGVIRDVHLILEAEEYYNKDFNNVDEVKSTYLYDDDPHEEDDEKYFYLLELDRFK